jgi:hypothetical protein
MSAVLLPVDISSARVWILILIVYCVLRNEVMAKLAIFSECSKEHAQQGYRDSCIWSSPNLKPLHSFISHMTWTSPSLRRDPLSIIVVPVLLRVRWFDDILTFRDEKSGKPSIIYYIHLGTFPLPQSSDRLTRWSGRRAVFSFSTKRNANVYHSRSLSLYLFHRPSPPSTLRGKKIRMKSSLSHSCLEKVAWITITL